VFRAAGLGRASIVLAVSRHNSARAASLRGACCWSMALISMSMLHVALGVVGTPFGDLDELARLGASRAARRSWKGFAEIYVCAY